MTCSPLPPLLTLITLVTLITLLTTTTASPATTSPLQSSLLTRPVGENCTTCHNGETCCGGETCCSGGKFCALPGTTCCGDTTCEDTTQSCCPDPVKGGICCERESSFCCAPSGQLPSRCCPRWFVCCNSGKYGCCDPGVLGSGLGSGARRSSPFLDAIFGAPFLSAHPKKLKEERKEGRREAPLGVENAVGLMVIPELTTDGAPVYGVSFTLENAHKEKHAAITEFDNYGESTRVFAYSQATKLFYLPRANFTGPPGNDTTRTIHLYAVNPTTGTTSVKVVAADASSPVQPTGLVTGFAVVQSKTKILMATYAYPSSSSQTSNGYHFWEIDLESGSALLMGTHTRGSGQADAYVGWFRRAVVVDGAYVAYRLGYKDVVASTGPGVGVTFVSISGSGTGAITPYFVDVAPPSGYDPLLTLDVAAASGTSFLSLAPAAKGLSTDIALISWALNVTSPSHAPVLAAAPALVSKLENAHTEPYFGPIGGSVSSDFSTYAAMVVHAAVDLNYDSWALAVHSIHDGKTVTKKLSPLSLATLESLSGFALP